MLSDAEILEEARRYVTWDPNDETKSQINIFLETSNLVELRSALSTRLAFGTAGLRGAMGAGYNKMNVLVMLQTTQGISKYLFDHLGADAKTKGVVIGYDHRKLGSLSSIKFARMSAAVLLRQGFKVLLLEGFVPTPFVAFAVQHFQCAAGFMITASHNPKGDNGFKIYWGNGAQIIPPHDTGIADAILASLIPWQEKYDLETVLQHKNVTDVTSETAAAYYTAINSLVTSRERNLLNPVKVVYTAMHGVGAIWVKEAFSLFGHEPFTPVISQNDPDPEFRTVSFPNPEENGALNEAISTATQHGINLVIANDPDADRLAVAEYVPKTDENGSSCNQWYLYTGNDLGVMLGYWQIKKWKESCTKVGTKLVSKAKYQKRVAVLASVVSSRMLKAIAAAEGVEYYDTLTGFKWIGNKALALKKENVSVLFSYEEALGYCVGDVVADKDGVSAAAVFVEMAGELLEIGCTVHSYLQSLHAKYGQFISYNSYLTCHVPAVIDAIFSRLRKGGPYGEYWHSCGGVGIVSTKDVTLGYDSASCDKTSDLPTTKDSNMIMYEFANGCSVTLRTSGTEPKIKFYTEIAGNRSDPRSKYELEKELKIFVDVLINEFLQPDLNNLVRCS